MLVHVFCPRWVPTGRFIQKIIETDPKPSWAGPKGGKNDVMRQYFPIESESKDDCR